jgi:hypothetical protein
MLGSDAGAAQKYKSAIPWQRGVAAGNLRNKFDLFRFTKAACAEPSEERRNPWRRRRSCARIQKPDGF